MQRYSIHPVCSLSPRMSEARRKEFVSSIREHGVRSRVLTWTDSSKKVWVVDGRERVEEYFKLLKKKQINPKVHKIEYENIGRMSEEDMVRYVFDLTLRKDYDSGQRAVMCILFDQRWKKGGEERGEDAAKQNPQGEGRLGDWLAERYDTNRTYLSQAQALVDYKGSLVRKVLDGKLSLADAFDKVKPKVAAKREKKKRARKAKQKPADNGSLPLLEETESADDGNEVFDGMKTKVTDQELQNVFLARPSWSEVLRTGKEFLKAALELCDAPGGQHLTARKAVFREQIENGLSIIRGHTPYTVCHVCDGTKRVKDKDTNRPCKCEACDGAGFLDPVRYQATKKLKTQPDPFKGD